MSIKNYQEGDINDQSLIINANNINSYDIKTENDLLVKTQDGNDYVKFNTPDKGQAGYQLTVDVNGNAYWAMASATGGVDNPMSQNLDGNNFNIVNVPNYQNTTDINIVSGTRLILSAPNEIKLSNGFATKLDINATDTKFFSNNISFDNKDLTQTNEIHMDFITSNQNANIRSLVDIDMFNSNIFSINSLDSGILNGNILIRSENDLPNPITAGNYLIMGDITFLSSYTLAGDVSFFGLGREGESSMNFQIPIIAPGACINITDYSCSFNNLTLTNQSAIYILLEANNTAKDKILTFSNCKITNCKNSSVFNIQGFDLVDCFNCLFQYNYPTVHHFYHNNGSKLQITSCEFLRQGQEANPITNWGTAPMITLDNNFGAINISSNLIHPQQTQDGINIKNTFTSLEALISSNTFISVGLTTGILINYNTSINQYPSLIVDNNTGIINQKSLLEGQSINNTTYTATTSGVWEPVNFGTGFTTPNINRFSTTATPFEFKYDAKQPIKCLVNVNITADHDTKGDDTILFGISKNGSIVSQIQTDIKDGADKTFGFNTILELSQNDLLQFKVQNLTAGTDINGFRATGFNGSLIEV
jgi:hypothetical protein